MNLSPAAEITRDALVAEFAAAGSFIFGQSLKSIEHVSLEELKEH